VIWLLNRAFSMVLVFVAVLSFVFFLTQALPGDPADYVLGELASAQDKAQFLKTHGLDLPVHTQYFKYLGQALSGDLGQSLSRRVPVVTLLQQRVGPTVQLAIFAMCLSLALSALSAFVSLKVTRLKWVVDSFCLASNAVPIFVVGPLLVWLLAIHFEIFPVAGYGSPWHIVLPGLSLALVSSGLLIRMVVTTLVEVSSEDFVRTARSKGLKEARVFWVHMMRNSLLPVLPQMGATFGSLLAGAFVTETLFDWPGLGRLFVSAFQSRDYPLVQGTVVWIAALFIVVNLVTELVQKLLDPRLRSA
jgi:peptide/nickel transport system permease protein